MLGRVCIAALAAILLSCSGAAPPYGTLVLSVGTDLEVPRLLARLRVDVIGEGGTILESREASLRDRSALPASFVVYTRETRRSILVRVRGYPDGAVVDGGDPDAALAVDRLLEVDLVDGTAAEASVALLGACSGVAAKVEERVACLDETGQLRPAPGASFEPLPSPGSFGLGPAIVAAPRAKAEGDEGEIVVPAGAFVLGGRDVATNRAWAGVPVASAPPRLVAVSSFLVDAHEVTVGRFRAAIARGFVPPAMPLANEGPLTAAAAPGIGTGACTFSAAPSSREAMPLSCVDWATARAFCRFEGGDLPTEAEWEWAASAAGRPAKVTFPWGDQRPACGEAVFARVQADPFELTECLRAGRPAGPARVTEDSDTTPLGIRGLGGNVAEWTVDAYAAYDGCASTRIDPRCDREAERRVTRGGAFTEGWSGGHVALRKPALPGLPFAGIGFRCVRRSAS